MTWRAVVLLSGLLATPGAASAAPARLFADDFERGLGAWDVVGADGVAIRESGDPARGRVLVLTPAGDVLALIRGSAAWAGVRLEGTMRFPTDEDNYLGFVYRHTRVGDRRDFGLVYLKGNDGYLQVNPHRDFNVSRLIYPELRAGLSGHAAVRTGQWQRFAVEVVGRTVHVYVGEGAVPQLTFDGYEGDRGEFGLQPRSVGGEVWVDDVTAGPLDALSYTGPPRPPAYAPETLLTRWQVAGPFGRSRDDIARDPGASAAWREMAADRRGAVVTGRVVDYHGPDAVAYFRTTIDAPGPAAALLEVSTADDLAIWLNGAFQGFVARQDAAWFDVGRSSDHAGRRVPLRLRAGANEVVLRVRGGVYASGGFFARLSEGGGR
ncbi:MAG: hypothetical protein AB7H93_24550 [Vicinamibacterales bacterium]